MILKEDACAKIVLDTVLERLGESTQSLFKVCFLPGGASAIFQRLATAILPNDNIFIILDGDQKRNKDIPILENLPMIAQDSPEILLKIIKDITGSEIKFFFDKGQSPKTEQLIAMYKKYISLLQSNLQFLPKATPEELIWDLGYAKNRLTIFRCKENIIEQVISSGDAKQKII